MTVKPKLDKKALKEAVRLAQLALSAAETAERFPSQRRKCKYCGTQFNTPATYNGQQMRFCTAAHRKAFDKEGEKPIDVILRKQENRMRKIAREEALIVFEQLAAETRRHFGWNHDQPTIVGVPPGPRADAILAQYLPKLAGGNGGNSRD